MPVVSNTKRRADFIIMPIKQKPMFGFRPMCRPLRSDSFGGDEAEYNEEIRSRIENNCLFYEDQQHKSELVQRLNTLRRNREQCDVVVYVGNREIYAHQTVLAALSPRLCQLLSERQVGDRMSDDSIDDNNCGSPMSSGEEHDRILSSLSSVDFKVPAQPAVRGHKSDGVHTGFSNPITSAPSENAEQPAYIELPRYDFDCFQALVDYGYTSRLETAIAKVPELYKTASLLGIDSCARMCASYLAEHLRPDNCIAVRRAAARAHDERLTSLVDQFIQDNFAVIIQTSNEFTSLPQIQVQLVGAAADVDMDELNMEALSGKVLHWLQCTEHADAGKEFRIDMLTEKTHMVYVNADSQLQDVNDLDDASSVGSCDMVTDYKKMEQRANWMFRRSRSLSGQAGLMGSHTGSLSQLTNATNGTVLHNGIATQAAGALQNRSSHESLTSEHSGDSANTGPSDHMPAGEHTLIAVNKLSDVYICALVVVRGYLCSVSIQLLPKQTILSRGSNVHDERLAFVHRCLGGHIPLATMQRPRCAHGTVLMPDKTVIVAGGYDRGECMSSVESFSLSRNEWLPLPDMRSVRGRFDATVCDGRVYCVAGSDGGNDLRTAECYDPQKGDWRPIASLHVARSHNGITSVGGKVYCIGGWNGTRALKDCEVYDPSADKWTYIAPLQNGRYQSGVCSWRDRVLVAGGCDQWNCTNDVLMYDTTANVWTTLPLMPNKRRGNAAVVVGDKLYVIGGCNGQVCLTSVDVLDLCTMEWATGQAMTVPRANVSVCVLPDEQSIAVFGGFNGKAFMNTIEVLDINQNEWRSHVRMPVPVPEPISEADDDHNLH